MCASMRAGANGNRTQLQIVFQVFEGRFDLDELNVELPELSRIFTRQIGT